MPSRSAQSVLVFALLLSITSHDASAQRQYFKIQVVDGATGRGVPLVELRTTNETRWFTDSNGIVAYDDEGTMGHKVFFSISAHGYSFPKDGFGYAGIALDVKPGGSARVEIQRVNIAERLYRVTGEGIYRDSLMIGQAAPTRSPLFNGQVMGQDTVEVTPYRGKLYWFWGDTSRSDYPLGNFHTSGATSALPGTGGLNPAEGIDLTYFTDASGFCKAMLPNKEPGPVWIGGLCTVTEPNGKERLLCNYARMKGLGDAQERGLALFNDEREEFEPICKLDLNHPVCPLGHPCAVNVSHVEYIYSAVSDSDPVLGVRVSCGLKQVMNPSAYETYTCLALGSRYDGENSTVDRDADGGIRYGWKAATGSLNWKQEQELIRDGILKPGEALIQLRDVETGKHIQPAGGSVFWNKYTRKWVMIFGQFGGSTSLLGEVWYSSADTPTGPWVYARKIVSHNNYSFYNPTQDSFFDQQDGKRIYFEGTYTRTFSDNKDPTPRYDYNQIMYGLSLDDSRLALPAPVYQTVDTKGIQQYGIAGSLTGNRTAIQSILFFAVPPTMAHEGLIPLYAISTPSGTRLVTQLTEKKAILPLAYVAPLSDSKSRSEPTIELYEYHKADGSWIYSTDPTIKKDRVVRDPNPICRVLAEPNDDTAAGLVGSAHPK